MEPGFGILSGLRWVEYFFPGLSDYIEIIAPIFFVALGLLSVFSDIIPHPNHKYPVPEKIDLELDMEDNSKFVIFISKLARLITIGINWYISTFVYKWFYKMTKFGAAFVGHLKMVRNIKRIKQISPPEPFVSNDRRIDHDEEPF
jgi:hypothetical protein